MSRHNVARPVETPNREQVAIKLQPDQAAALDRFAAVYGESRNAVTERVFAVGLHWLGAELAANSSEDLVIASALSPARVFVVLAAALGDREAFARVGRARRAFAREAK